MRTTESKIVQILVQDERKACGGFGGAEIRDCEAKDMAMLGHRHRKQFIQK